MSLRPLKLSHMSLIDYERPELLRASANYIIGCSRIITYLSVHHSLGHKKKTGNSKVVHLLFHFVEVYHLGKCRVFVMEHSIIVHTLDKEGCKKHYEDELPARRITGLLNEYSQWTLKVARCSILAPP